MEEKPDTSAAKVLVLTHRAQAEMWSLDLVVEGHGPGPLAPGDVGHGLLMGQQHSPQPVGMARSSSSKYIPCHGRTGSWHGGSSQSEVSPCESLFPPGTPHLQPQASPSHHDQPTHHQYQSARCPRSLLASSSFLSPCESELFRDGSRGLDGGGFFAATLLNRKEAQTSEGKNSVDSLKELFILKSEARFIQYFEKYSPGHGGEHHP